MDRYAKMALREPRIVSHFDLAEMLEVAGCVVRADDETGGDNSRSLVYADDNAEQPFAEIVGDDVATFRPLVAGECPNNGA